MTNEELYYLPASELLRHIQDEKERLVKEKIIKKSKPLPPITEEEKPYDLPIGWEWVRLGEVCDIFNGNSINAQVKSTHYDGLDIGYPYIATKDVKDDVIIYENGVKIPFETNLKIARKGSTLVCSEGGSAGKKVGILNQDVCFGNKLFAIQQYSPILENKFIYYFALSFVFKNQFNSKLNGMIGGVSLNNFKSLLFPLPPLYIQDQIVKKLEQLSETKESVLSHAESQLKDTKKMRESLLQEAMRGELVPQDENDEPASVLLEKIKAEKERLIKEKAIKKQKELSPITPEEKSFELPKGWEWVRLGDVAQFNPRNKASDDDLVGFIPMASITDGFSNTHSFETKKWVEVKSGYTHFATNDVIFAKITPCFENRKSTIVKELPNRIGAGTTEVITLRSYANTILPGYLLSLVNSPAFINGGKLTYLGTAGQQRVNAEFLKNYVFALPPLAEQERIVTKIDELMANCDQLEAKAEEMKNYTSKLFEASLKEAFMPE